MNVPGKLGEYWTWRFRWEDLTPEIEQRMLDLATQTGRA
jgi:4-alpha-glucanotransferase